MPPRERLALSLTLLLADLWKPSAADEAPYEWMVIGMAHGLLGAVLATLLPVNPLVLGIVVATAYYTLKEVGDVRRGGGVADGIQDTAFVFCGALYVGAWWWPWLIGTTAFIGAMARYYRRLE